MGHKVNPLGLRLNLTGAWESVWYFNKKDYGRIFCEDLQIRKYLLNKLAKAAVKSIILDRSAKKITVNIHSAKLGLVIGKQGNDIKEMKDYVAKVTGLETMINTLEVKNPDLLAGLVAKSIAKQMEARLNYKRAMKRAIRAAMSTGALGIKICCSGRLGGVEIARNEWYREGSIPLHTLRANIDYGQATAFTTYGCCGVKVWICCPQVVEPDKAKTEKVAIQEDAKTVSDDGKDVKVSNVDKASNDAEKSNDEGEFFISSLTESKVAALRKQHDASFNTDEKSTKTVAKKAAAKSSVKKDNARLEQNNTSVVDKTVSNEENKTE